jgi:hypothetical protein
MFPFISVCTAFFPLIALSPLSQSTMRSHTENYRSPTFIFSTYNDFLSTYYVTTAIRDQYFPHEEVECIKFEECPLPFS